MQETQYYESPALRNLAEKLKERYYPYLGHADLDNIYFCELDGVKPKAAPICSLDGLSKGWVRDLLVLSKGDPKHYCISVWSAEWENLSQSHIEWYMFKALFMVGDNNDGKIRKPDILDFGFILEYFVANGYSAKWETEKELPSLLNSKLPLPIPLPEEYDF
jgi:hypothetical protein